MPQPSSIHLPWLEDRIADLWPLADTVDIARKILVPESWVANALARMRRRNDPRLRSVTSR
jgi:hypothetical protein